MKSKIRRQKIKKLVKRHGGEILAGLLVGLLTDIATELVQAHLRKKILRKFR